jgi:ankyrin repeat protein
MISINQHDSCYETPLSIAVKAGNETAITYLLDCCNVDPNASCRGCDEATPLHVAAQSLRFNVVSMLIAKWKVNANARDRYQRTPLHLVVSVMMSSTANAWLGEKVVKELIAAGSQLSAKDINGNTPRDLFEARKNINEYTEESFQNMNLRELLTKE